MSFDWGGFTGGIIGTLGAFGAVQYSFWKQRKIDRPFLDKKRLDIINVIRGTLDKYWWEINRFEAEDITDVFIKSNSIVATLEGYLGIAIESNNSIGSIILETIEELDKTGNEYSRQERTNQNLLEYLNAILELLSRRISKCDELKEKILKNYKSK